MLRPRSQSAVLLFCASCGEAAVDGNTAIVECLLENSAWAAYPAAAQRRGRQEVWHELIGLRDQHGTTAEELAAVRGHEGTARRIRTLVPFDPPRQDGLGPEGREKVRGGSKWARPGRDWRYDPSVGDYVQLDTGRPRKGFFAWVLISVLAAAGALFVDLLHQLGPATGPAPPLLMYAVSVFFGVVAKGLHLGFTALMWIGGRPPRSAVAIAKKVFARMAVSSFAAMSLFTILLCLA